MNTQEREFAPRGTSLLSHSQALEHKFFLNIFMVRRGIFVHPATNTKNGNTNEFLWVVSFFFVFGVSILGWIFWSGRWKSCFRERKTRLQSQQKNISLCAYKQRWWLLVLWLRMGKEKEKSKAKGLGLTSQKPLFDTVNDDTNGYLIDILSGLDDMEEILMNIWDGIIKADGDLMDMVDGLDGMEKVVDVLKNCKLKEVDDILHRGYKSCCSSDLNATEECAGNGLHACHGSDIYAGDDVVCFGEYGCKYAEVTSDGNIWCDGRYGCKFTDLTVEINIYCDGEYTCRLNDIYNVNYLYVEEAGGAQVSNIYDFNRIYSWGYVALKHAYINTTGVSKPIVVFGGYKKTVDATFIGASGKCTFNDFCLNISDTKPTTSPTQQPTFDTTRTWHWFFFCFGFLVFWVFWVFLRTDPCTIVLCWWFFLLL